MSVIGERQVTVGMCEWQESFGLPKKAGFRLIIEGFWLSDKFLIRAETNHPAPTIKHLKLQREKVRHGKVTTSSF
jgi:hypothetical protein